MQASEQLLSWKNSGFSIHEKVRIETYDKQGREHLLYYCARPALSQARLVNSAKSKTVLYRADPRVGRSELLTMSSLEFLRRWGSLMPPPNKNLVRYYGALGPHSPMRAGVVAKAVEATARARWREKLELRECPWPADDPDDAPAYSLQRGAFAVIPPSDKVAPRDFMGEPHCFCRIAGSFREEEAARKMFAGVGTAAILGRVHHILAADGGTRYAASAGRTAG